MRKFWCCGFREISTERLISYLTNRKKTTPFGSHKSVKLESTWRVLLQGLYWVPSSFYLKMTSSIVLINLFSFFLWMVLISFTPTRRCGSVYLGVVVLSVGEVCYVYEGYVGSAVVLYTWGVSWDVWSSRHGVILQVDCYKMVGVVCEVVSGFIHGVVFIGCW